MTTAIDIRTEIRSGIRLTLDEFLELPPMEQRCELIDGVLRMAAFPIPDHQFLAGVLTSRITQQITETGLGIALPETGLILARDSAVGPDITIIRADRTHIIGDTVINDAPDIVVEVLSSNRRADLVRKRELYAAIGIPEYWILDGAADTLTVLALGPAGSYRERAILTAADTLTTPLFPQFRLPLAQLFGHQARPRRQAR